MKTTRRNFFGAGALLGASLFTFGAGPIVAQEMPAVKRGGVVNASMYQQPISLHPMFGNATIGDHIIYNQIFDALLRTQADGSFAPALATGWEFREDNKVLVFTLRDDVVFHDGTSFNAGAAEFNLNLVMDPESVAPHSKDLALVESVKATGDYELTVTFKEANGTALVPFAGPAAMMSSPTAIEKFGDDYGRNPVGTGPFEFVEWRSDEYIQAERNEDYWRVGSDDQPLPYLDGVNMRFISSTATKIIEVQSGNLHLADDITPREAVRLEEDDRVKLVSPPPGGLQSWLAFNNGVAPFDNIALRQAIIAGIDREGLLKAIALGVGEVPPFIFASSEWAYSDAPKQAAYDPEAAKQILADAGISNPTVTLSLIQRDPDAQIAQIIQAQLSQIGINVELEVLERQGYVEKVLSAKHQFSLGRWPIPFGDPDQIAGLLFGPGAALDWANIDDPVLEQLVVDARLAVTHEERAPIYQKMQEHVLENAYYDFLMMRGVKHIASPNLHGFTHELTGSWFLDTAYFN